MKGESEDIRLAMDKVFNDSVHGHIKLPPLCVKIIDTLEFQRLRNIKQLGFVYLVYPGASHNRFEHSIGVCHLAGLLVDHLMRQVPSLDITAEDKLCVEIAGLCHDLGHGPFSHMWERFVNPLRVRDKLPPWAHETSSLEMFDLLVKNNKLMDEFVKFNLTEEHIKFIKDLILGKKSSENDHPKPYLYQIVANKDNDIDVDKWDYLLRDGFHQNLKESFDYRRLIASSRVVEVEPSGPQRNYSWHICYRDKDALNIFNMFHVRARLHYLSYQHPVVKCLDTMFIDAFTEAANAGYSIQQQDGSSIRVDRLQDNVSALSRISDHIFFDLLYSTDPRYQEARKILERMQRRELYPLVTKYLLKGQESELEDKKELMRDFCCTKVTKRFNFEEFRFTTLKLNFGSANDNPFEKVYFYQKHYPNKAASKDIREIFLFPIECSHFKRYELFLFCTLNKQDVTDGDRKNIQKHLTPSTS